MMRTFRSSIAVSLSGICLVASALIGACSGGEFSTGADAGSAGSMAGAGPAGGSSSMPGGTVRCSGPDECDDENPCTIDDCGAEGSCVHTPKCAPGERCCDGLCGQCCEQEDCDDGVSCTSDQCFNLFCAYMPDDDACSSQQYCHRNEGCKERELCPSGTAEECDDDDPCTTDTCVDGLCEHEDCGPGQQCCENGCAECCGDAQCPDDGDPCTKELCQGGECHRGDLCTGDDVQCCVGAGSASCGACCTRDDCDDGIACTVDGCAGGECSHVPNDGLCDDNQTCDPMKGCITQSTCGPTNPCVSADPCVTKACVDGQCISAGCQLGATCCPGVGCRECCDNKDCDGGLCCGGVCRQCCSDYDCKELGAPDPAGNCQHNYCVQGICTVGWDFCGGFNDICCAPHGCQTGPFCASPD